MFEFFWIISAILVPIPLMHLWLHALISFWRKHAYFFYVFSFLLWIGSFFLFREVYYIFPYVIYFPSTISQYIAVIFVIIGFILLFASFLSLGPKRFFVWAVLRQDSVSNIRVVRGPFKFFPHPAYTGYLFISFAAFLLTGFFYMAFSFLFLFSFTPIVIFFENEELSKRLKG
ncbi:hypothetical protein HYV56_00090 [Candidatus Peregrinibacteria bacterium]|nr:hypothetical protein [Candidatus Peregrinibacteria bacterium]